MFSKSKEIDVKSKKKVLLIEHMLCLNYIVLNYACFDRPLRWARTINVEV